MFVTIAAHHGDVFDSSRVISAILTPQRTNHVQDILNIRHSSGLTKRANGEPVTTVTIAVAEVDVVRRAADR